MCLHEAKPRTCNNILSFFIYSNNTNNRYSLWGWIIRPRTIIFLLRLLFHLGYRGLWFASRTNLESGPRFAEVCSLTTLFSYIFLNITGVSIYYCKQTWLLPEQNWGILYHQLSRHANRQGRRPKSHNSYDLKNRTKKSSIQMNPDYEWPIFKSVRVPNIKSPVGKRLNDWKLFQSPL